MPKIIYNTSVIKNMCYTYCTLIILAFCHASMYKLIFKCVCCVSYVKLFSNETLGNSKGHIYFLSSRLMNLFHSTPFFSLNGKMSLVFVLTVLYVILQ
jgi:hypothetical protein